jgi:hypothetical protein
VICLILVVHSVPGGPCCRPFRCVALGSYTHPMHNAASKADSFLGPIAEEQIEVFPVS